MIVRQPARWAFECTTVADLPPRAWIARISNGSVVALCGRSVRREPNGLFEGTWAGPSEISAAANASAVFGSGVVADGPELTIVSPSHTLEPTYHAHAGRAGLLVSNSLVGLLVALGRDVDAGAGYPSLFSRILHGLAHASIEVPTTTAPVTVNYFENLAVRDGATLSVRAKPLEPAFESFADYRDRLVDAVSSCFANAPGHQPLATVSSGYDSAASAAVGARSGCRRAATFSSGWPWQSYSGTADSGASTAASLGMSVTTFERLAYLELDDAPEAEFLATGMTGEDVVYRSMEDALKGSIVLTGFWGGAAWRGLDRPGLSRLDLSGASMGEFRLRSDFIHLPVPYIGGRQQPSVSRMRAQPEMRAYSVGGRYDEPIARRLAEEAGVVRGTFGTQKLATSQKLHAMGLAAFSASGRASFEAYAGSETLRRLPTRSPIGRRHRLVLRAAESLHADRLVEGLAERRRGAVHLEPVLGSLLLRWAVSEMRGRYREAIGFGTARD